MKNFTAKQKEIIARKLGYDGPMQGFDEFVQSSPALAMKYEMINDKYTERMNKGGAVMRYQDGGSVPGGMVADKEKAATDALTKNADIVAKVRERFPDYNPDKMTADFSPADQYYGELLRGGTVDDGKKRINPADRSKETAAGGAGVITSPSPQQTEAERAQQYATGTKATDAEIRSLYRSVLGRDADEAGLQFYKTSNFSPEQIRQQLSTSDEYKKRSEAERAQQYATGTKATDAEIASVYKEVLGREPDKGGFDFYKTSNFSADQIRQQLLNSDEYKKSPSRRIPPTQYGETGVPQAGSVQQNVAAQTEITPEMKLDADQYQAPESAPTAQLTTAAAAPAVGAPTPVTAQPIGAVKTTETIAGAIAPVRAATGVAPVIQAQQLTPEQMQASMAQAQTLDQAQKVQQAQRTLQEGELVSGPAVDMKRAEEAIAKTKAELGQVTEDMTVQGQLTKLTANFDAANPPPWAAGAIRSVTAQLAARGLAASSMAGQAVVQAALEMAIPIASADAQAYRQMESQNLSNRQQVAVLAAQQRAQFLGQEFDQEFQTRVQNASRIADIANMNFTAEQQVYLENARLAQSVDLANLNNRQATVIANAATIANMQTANLSARQQAAVANAQNFLQMSVANMSNEQQVSLFKAQALTQSILSDAAAENAARQFNASSKQQADQFNTQISTQVSQFNTAQKNAMEQFNAGQANALAQFNAQMDAQREEFNTRNRIVIDQANAQLLAQISTANTAQVNAVNFQNAQAMNNMTMAQYNNEVQLYRDQVKMVYDTYERAEDRAASMATAMLQVDIANKQIDAKTSESYGRLLSSLIGTDAGGKAVDKVIDWVGGLFG